MHWELFDRGSLVFPEYLICVVGLRPRLGAILLRQPVGEDCVDASGDCGDSAAFGLKLAGLREQVERFAVTFLKLVVALVLVGADGAVKRGAAFPGQQISFGVGAFFE